MATDGQWEYSLLCGCFIGASPDDAVWNAMMFTKNRERLPHGDKLHRFMEKLSQHQDVAPLLVDEQNLVPALHPLAAHRYNDRVYLGMGQAARDQAQDEPQGFRRSHRRLSAQSDRLQAQPHPGTFGAKGRGASDPPNTALRLNGTSIHLRK